MGLREDLEDLCVGIAATSNAPSSKPNPLEENVNALLALKSRYKVEDTEAFVNMFEEAASASLWSLPSPLKPQVLVFNFLKLEPPLQSVLFSLLLELGLKVRSLVLVPNDMKRSGVLRISHQSGFAACTA